MPRDPATYLEHVDFVDCFDEFRYPVSEILFTPQFHCQHRVDCRRVKARHIYLFVPQYHSVGKKATALMMLNAWLVRLAEKPQAPHVKMFRVHGETLSQRAFPRSLYLLD